MQPFGLNRHVPKIGELRSPFWGLDPNLTQNPLAEAYLHTKWHLDASSRLATIEMGGKFGGSAPFLGEVSGVSI